MPGAPKLMFSLFRLHRKAEEGKRAASIVSSEI